MPKTNNNTVQVIPEIGTPEWWRTYRDALAAIRWTQNNPTAWNQMQQTMLDDCHKNKYTSVNLVIKRLRPLGLVDADGAATTMRAQHMPILNRLFLANHPEAARWVSLNPCRFDASGMPWDTDVITDVKRGDA